MPITLQPMMRAIWPAVAPTAPAADEISTVSPGFRGADIAQAEIGGEAGNVEDAGPGAEMPGVLRDLLHAAAAHLQMLGPAGQAPQQIADREIRFFDSITRPIAGPSMVSPMLSGRA